MVLIILCEIVFIVDCVDFILGLYFVYFLFFLFCVDKFVYMLLMVEKEILIFKNVVFLNLFLFKMIYKFVFFSVKWFLFNVLGRVC